MLCVWICAKCASTHKVMFIDALDARQSSSTWYCAPPLSLLSVSLFSVWYACTVMSSAAIETLSRFTCSRPVSTDSAAEAMCIPVRFGKMMACAYLVKKNFRIFQAPPCWCRSSANINQLFLVSPRVAIMYLHHEIHNNRHGINLKWLLRVT